MAQPSCTFRIFVSSTFSDLKAERNALQERVFPKLRELCMQHGARFQAIDLRWGVSEEAAVDQQTMNICLEELRRCQRITPRPNVIVLLGERYGWMPLPPQIPAGEFDAILEKVSPEDRDLLLWRDDQPPDARGWYRRDDNAVPPEYVLPPRTGEHERYADSARWAELEARLHRILFDAVQQMDLPAAARRKYERSATEQEILEGAFQAGTDHAFCYFRTIEGLPQNERARDFLDVDEHGAPVSDARNRLADLKARLRRHFPAEHIYDYEAGWSGEGVTGDHLDSLCARVEADLSRVILEQIAGIEEQDDLTREVEAHRRFGEERCRHFIGREEIIERIRGYVRRGDNHPLMVWGVSGSGKSALMARCVELIHQELPSARLISRFVGATPASTDIRSLLESLCREICREYDQDEATVPGEYKDLVKDFPERLALATPNRPLILFLDALDQLSATDNAHALNWLPRELPDNVRIVASALERDGQAGECLRVARARLPDASLIEVTPLTPEQGGEILNIWLREAKRTLQEEQRADILSKFERCPLPLYLKLAFEEARRWKSYDGVPCGADQVPGLSEDIEGIIKDMLWRLEQPTHHGQTLVTKAMGYIAAARNGLTEDELLDVLSDDEDVFRTFIERSYHEPPERRLPVVVWSRLYFDLEPYLTERSADNASLLAFYHRQLAEVVAARYLTEERRRPLHGNLADYFFSQPHQFESDGQRTPNHRKVSELPYQQTYAQAWDALEQTLTDLWFVEAKAAAAMVLELAADCARAEYAWPGQEEQRRAEAARQQRIDEYVTDLIAYSRDPGNVPLPEPPPLVEIRAHEAEGSRTREWTPLEQVQAWGHFVGTHAQLLTDGTPPAFQLAFNSADSGPVAETVEEILPEWRARAQPWLRLKNRSAYTAHPACLKVLEGHANGVEAVSVTPDGRRAVSGSHDNTVRLWDLETGECLKVLEGHSYWVNAVSVTPDGRRAVSGSWDDTLRLWDLVTGECLKVLEGHADDVMAVSVTPDGRRAVSGSYDGTVRLWDLDTGACLRVLEGHAGAVEAVAVTPDGRRAVSGGNDRTLRLWDLETGACLKLMEGHAGLVLAVSMTPDGRRAVSGSGDVRALHNTLRLWDLVTGECLKVLEGHASYVVGVSVTPDGRRAVSGGDDGTVRLWDLETGACLKVLEGHAGWVRSVSVTPDGQRAVSGSWDHTLRLWDLQTGECLKVLGTRPFASGIWSARWRSGVLWRGPVFSRAP